ncbi:hypothetical protein FF1_040885 [Malus domestica]
MVKGVATYFSMTLGAFVFWQSMDENLIEFHHHKRRIERVLIEWFNYGGKIRFLGNWHEIWWLGYRGMGSR